MKSSSARPWEYFKTLFDFSYEEIEKDVKDYPDQYSGLNSAALYTCLEDLYQIMHHPALEGDWVDLGAGTGQSALLYASLFTERKAWALEISSARINAGKILQNKLQIKNAYLKESNLLKDEIPEGGTYFLYFPTGMILDRVLNELYNKKKDFVLVAIESHGDLLGRLKLENWLGVVGEVPLKSSRHHPQALIFKTKWQKRSDQSKPFQISFLEKYLLISEGDHQWIGESQGLTHHGHDMFDLLTPPRTIKWTQVQRICDLEEINPDFHFALGLRRLGQLNITTKSGHNLSFIRKIIIRPGFSLEIVTGEKIEWADIQSIYWGTTLCYESSSGYFFLPPVQP